MKTIEMIRMERLGKMIDWRLEHGASPHQQAELEALIWATTELVRCLSEGCE